MIYLHNSRFSALDWIPSTEVIPRKQKNIYSKTYWSNFAASVIKQLSEAFNELYKRATHLVRLLFVVNGSILVFKCIFLYKKIASYMWYIWLWRVEYRWNHSSTYVYSLNIDIEAYIHFPSLLQGKTKFGDSLFHQI